MEEWLVLSVTFTPEPMQKHREVLAALMPTVTGQLAGHREPLLQGARHEAAFLGDRDQLMSEIRVVVIGVDGHRDRGVPVG